MRRYESGSCRRSHRSLGAVKPGSARLPVSSISRARPTWFSISSHSVAGSLVVPENRWANDAFIGVECDEPMHLTREADAGELASRRYLGDRRLGRTPPVLRILLGPTGMRRRERIGPLGGCEHASVRGDRDRLDAGRSDVEADECFRHAPSAAYTSS